MFLPIADQEMVSDVDERGAARRSAGELDIEVKFQIKILVN